jgi:hypothetical protein
MVSAVSGRAGFTSRSATSCANGLYNSLGSVVRLHNRETTVITLLSASSVCEDRTVNSRMSSNSAIQKPTCILFVHSAIQRCSSSSVTESKPSGGNRALSNRFYHAEPPSRANGETTLNIRCENRDLTRFSSRRGVSFGDHQIRSARKYRSDLKAATYDSAGQADDRHASSCALDRSRPNALHDIHCNIKAICTD